jgi:hypothetical protein
MARITFRIDEKLLAKARAYACAHDTTLNHLFQEWHADLTGRIPRKLAAEEFARIALTRSGRSDNDFVFDRQAAHERGNGGT